MQQKLVVGLLQRELGKQREFCLRAHELIQLIYSVMFLKHLNKKERPKFEFSHTIWDSNKDKKSNWKKKIDWGLMFFSQKSSNEKDNFKLIGFFFFFWTTKKIYSVNLWNCYKDLRNKDLNNIISLNKVRTILRPKIQDPNPILTRSQPRKYLLRQAEHLKLQINCSAVVLHVNVGDTVMKWYKVTDMV